MSFVQLSSMSSSSGGTVAAAAVRDRGLAVRGRRV